MAGVGGEITGAMADGRPPDLVNRYEDNRRKETGKMKCRE